MYRLAAAAATTLLASIVSSQYTEQDFVQEVSCIDPTYQVPSQFSPRAGPVTLMANSPMDFASKKINDPYLFYKLFGSGHSWAAVGERCLHQSIDSLSDDCAPYSIIINKYQQMMNCFEDAFGVGYVPTGKWLNGKNQVENFDFYKITRYAERMVHRLAMLANKEVPTWNTNAELSSLFNDEEIESFGDTTRQCLATLEISRNDMKCWPVIMGEPGFSGLALFDHEGDIRSRAKVTDECHVAPVCARLAVEKLVHFQSLYFAKNLWRGYVTSTGIRNKKNAWVFFDEEQHYGMSSIPKHSKCQIKGDTLGPSLCWNFSECVPEMLKLVCASHAGCCPSLKIHYECLQDPTSAKCKICKKVDFPAFKIWHNFW